MNRERAGLSPRPGLDGGRRSWTRGRRLQRVGVLLVLAFGASCSSSDGGHDSARPGVTVLAPNSCDLVGCVGEGVDTAAGAYTMSSEDLLFPRGVFGLNLVRSYRSDRPAIGLFGTGWATVYETTLSMGSAGPVINAPAGLAPMWTPAVPQGWDVAGSVTVRDGSAGGAELVWPTGETWSFAVDGALASITAPYGQRVTIERGNGVPVAIRSSQGPSIVFETSGGRVITARTDDGREVQFVYQNEQLVKAAAPGLDLAYAYNADGRMVQLDGPSGTTSIGYQAGSVSSQSTASGHRFALTYDGPITTVTDDRVLTYRHDNGGRLIRIAEGENELAVRQFDDGGRLVESMDYAYPGKQVVRALTRSYRSGQLVKETSNGVTTEFAYDDKGRVTASSTGTDQVLFEYSNDSPLPDAITTPGRGRETFTHSDGFVTKAVDATGVISVTERDAKGNPVSWATGDQAAWTYRFDAEGNMTSTTAPSGRTWSATWGLRSTLLSEQDPIHRRWIYRYDAAGHVVEQQQPGGVTSHFAYDSLGRLAQETSPDGLTTRYEYDQAGSLAATIMPGERVWRSSTQRLAGGGSKVTVTAPDGTGTVSTIDSAGRELERRTVEADGTAVETQQHTFEFERPKVTIVMRGASRFESHTSYDEQARIAATTDTLDGATVGTTRYTYEAGQVSKAQNDQQQVDYRYDKAGRLLSVSTRGDVWSAAYESGRLTVTSHNDDATRIGYDIDARAVTVTNDAGTTTKWSFDDGDRPINRSVGGAVATFTWSDNDRLMDYRSPDGSHWTWAYDQAGRILHAAEPGDALTTYEYDNGALVRAHTTGSHNNRDDRFAYDSRGLLQTAKTAAGEFNYLYDATGKPTTIDGSGKEQWTYDAQGNVTAVQASSEMFSLDYDTYGRVQAITGPKTSLEASWTPDGLTSVKANDRDTLRLATGADGRLATVRWDDKTAVDLNWSTNSTVLDLRERGTDIAQHYELDDGHLTAFLSDEIAITSTHQDNGYLQSLHLDAKDAIGDIRFDQVGRPATLITDNATSTLSYDERGRVASVLTSRSGKEPDQTLVSYTDDGRQIDGDKKLVETMFGDDGALLTPLPSSLPNPLSAANQGQQLGGIDLGATRELLAPPEPQPLDDVSSLVRNATPPVTTPIGVRNLSKVAEQMLVAEVARLSPTIRVSGDTDVRLPVINPKNGELADFNPFVDAAPSGLALGQLSSQGGGGSSLLDRAKDTVGDIVGGVLSLASDVSQFVIDNPIARLVISVGTWAAAAVACAANAPACITLATVAVFITAAESAQTAVVSTVSAMRACSNNELAQCGLWAAGGVLAVAAAITAVHVGRQIAQTYFARRLYSAAIESGVGVARASERVGLAKSDVLEALRFRVIAQREVPVCAEQVCARLDRVTRDIFGTLRGVEVKNGAAARFTANQPTAYAALSTSGAYFPNGIAGSSPLMTSLRIEVQHWGTSVRLALP